jgi:type III pantothenate kinase
MSTTICLDFGNTRQKAALFAQGELKEIIVLEESLTDAVARLLEQYRPERAILSSVINHPPELEELLAAHTAFHKLSNASKLPFTLPVGKPETMGADRLAIAAAAVHLYPRRHNLVIALGSCITYNFINKDHQFMGGSISPGMEMRFKAMHQFTAKLPLVKGEWNVPLIGYDTATNLKSGVIFGMAKEMDGMIDEYQERYRNFNVLLTGGDLGFFEPHIKNRIFADPYLIFKGLYAISQVNHA